jgi:hypothetical protein
MVTRRMLVLNILSVLKTMRILKVFAVLQTIVMDQFQDLTKIQIF